MHRAETAGAFPSTQKHNRQSDWLIKSMATSMRHTPQAAFLSPPPSAATDTFDATCVIRTAIPMTPNHSTRQAAATSPAAGPARFFHGVGCDVAVSPVDNPTVAIAHEDGLAGANRLAIAGRLPG